MCIIRWKLGDKSIWDLVGYASDWDSNRVIIGDEDINDRYAKILAQNNRFLMIHREGHAVKSIGHTTHFRETVASNYKYFVPQIEIYRKASSDEIEYPAMKIFYCNRKTWRIKQKEAFEYFASLDFPRIE